jgi:hypothetical protein
MRQDDGMEAHRESTHPALRRPARDRVYTLEL